MRLEMIHVSVRSFWIARGAMKPANTLQVYSASHLAGGVWRKFSLASTKKNSYSIRYIEFLDTCMEYQMQFEKKVITQYKCLHEMNILSLISL